MVAALAYGSGILDQLSFSNLARHKDTLTSLVEAHPVLAASVFVLVYTAAAGLSVPGCSVLTIAGGLLFGTLPTTVLVVVAATAGACGLFLIARTSLGQVIRERAGPRFNKVAKGFVDNGFSYLLAMRLVPIFPFWLVNLAPAFTGMALTTFASATLIGIIPGSFVYASIGNGIGAVLEAGGEPDLALIYDPQILLPLVGLAFLSLLPVALKPLRKRNPAAPGPIEERESENSGQPSR